MFRKRRIPKFFSRILILLIILLAIFSAIAILYPLEYIEYIDKYSKMYDIDPFLVSAIINVESKYDKDAISHKDARGLMQIGPTTGKWASEVLNIENYNSNMLFIPEINIRIGTWYLSVLSSQFGDNLDLVLAAYNAGSGNVQDWLRNDLYSEDGIDLDNIPFKETADYLVKVRLNLKIYNLFYDNWISNSEDLGDKYLQLMKYIRINLLDISDSYSKEDIV